MAGSSGIDGKDLRGWAGAYQALEVGCNRKTLQNNNKGHTIDCRV